MQQSRTILFHQPNYDEVIECDSGEAVVVEPQQKLLDQLRSRIDIGESGWAMIGMQSGAAFPLSIMTPNVADWAAETASEMVDLLPSDWDAQT